MKNLLVLLTVLLFISCYTVPDIEYVESKPVLQEITSYTTYHVDVNYYYQPPFSVKTTEHRFYLEDDINIFYQELEVGRNNALQSVHYNEVDSVELYIRTVDSRGSYTGVVYRWRGSTGYYNTKRAYVYKEMLK